MAQSTIQKPYNAYSTSQVTLESGISSAGSNAIYRCGDIGILSLYLNSFSLPATWSNKTLGTIPTGFRPKGSISYSKLLQNDGLVRVIIGTDGKIAVSNVGTYTGSTNLFGITVAYVCN